MTVQTKAERLADTLDVEIFVTMEDLKEAAAELRRLVSFNNSLMDEVARLQKREFVGLTDEERDRIWSSYRVSFVAIGHIEAKLKEKNHD